MATVKKKQTSELVPYSGADQTVDLGSQNIVTTGTITAATFVGAGSGGGSWGTITGTLSSQTDLQSALDLKAAITDIAELAQDAVGTILTDSSSIDFTYTDGTPSITAIIAPLGVTNAMLAGSIAASKLVGTDITALGTISQGTWNATTIGVNRGGTGNTTFTANRLIVGNGSSALSTVALGTANQIVGMNNAGTANEYKTLSLGTTAQSNDIGWVLTGANAAVLHIPDASATVRGVLTTGAQTLAGVKTFNSIPVLPASDPTTANQAVRKSYVDAIALTVDKSLLKLACRTVAITNGTLATAYENGDTVNGVIVATNDRILLTAQTDSAENGIYVVNASGAPTRANDYDVAGEVVIGSQVYVTSGNNPGLYVMISPSVTTLGTDPITFTQIAGLSSYDFVVGNSGTDFNVDISGQTITYNLPTASATNRGALSSTDWSSFNSKAGLTGATTANAIAIFNDTIGTVKTSEIEISSATIQSVTAGAAITIQSKAATSFGAGGIVTVRGGDAWQSSSQPTSQNGGASVLEGGLGWNDDDEVSVPGASISVGGGRGDYSNIGIACTGTSLSMTDQYTAKAFVISTPTASGVTNAVFTTHTGGAMVADGVITLTDGATVALSADQGNLFTLTASGNRTILAPSGTPHSGQRITIRHLASGADRTLSLTTGSSGAFRFSTTIPELTATVSGTYDYITSIWNSAVSRWDVIDYTKGSQTSPTNTISYSTDVQIFTSSGTWTKPSGSPKTTQIIAIGGGGGGGSGRKGAAGTVRAGGAGGGPGGYFTGTFLTSVLGATETVTVGTGGSGGAAISTNTTNGAAGSNGVATEFGGWVNSGRGGGGGGGTTGAATGGAGSTIFPGNPSTSGANGASSSGSGAAGTGGSATFYAGAGGGSGGGITTGNVASAGGVGGSLLATGATQTGYGTSVAGGTAGAVSTNGGVGGSSPTNSAVGGAGGGGGGSSITTNAGNGGNGGLYGAGGGGGGGATNDVGNSGAGGTGGNGICIVITTY